MEFFNRNEHRMSETVHSRHDFEHRPAETMHSRHQNDA